MHVYEIPEQNYAELTSRFEKMVNRARKCKTVAPVFQIINRHEETKTAPDGTVNIQLFYSIVLDGELPKVKDWQFVATIDHTSETGNIIRNVPGTGNIPVAFRQSAPSCEHCGHARRRHETFVLRHTTTGEYKQVGRNCLADFFDGELADYVVSLTELWESLGEMMGEMEEGFFGREITRYPVLSVLTLTQAVISHRGWLSKAKAREMGSIDGFGNAPIPTATFVADLLAPPSQHSRETKKLIRDMEESPIDTEVQAGFNATSETAIEWARSIDPETESDYLYNLHVISKGESVDAKGLGLLCSLIPAYRRVMEEQREMESKPISQHVGEEGVRQLFQDVKVEWIGQASYSQWGATTPIKFVDQSGNILMLWNSGDADDYKVGETISIVGTVKSHTQYKGDAQTLINRVKPWDGKPVKVAKKKK